MCRVNGIEGNAGAWDAADRGGTLSDVLGYRFDAPQERIEAARRRGGLCDSVTRRLPHHHHHQRPHPQRSPRTWNVLKINLQLKQGYLSFWNDHISYALRGCMLIELALRRRIGVVGMQCRALRAVCLACAAYTASVLDNAFGRLGYEEREGAFGRAAGAHVLRAVFEPLCARLHALLGSAELDVVGTGAGGGGLTRIRAGGRARGRGGKGAGVRGSRDVERTGCAGRLKVCCPRCTTTPKHARTCVIRHNTPLQISMGQFKPAGALHFGNNKSKNGTAAGVGFNSNQREVEPGLSTVDRMEKKLRKVITTLDVVRPDGNEHPQTSKNSTECRCNNDLFRRLGNQLLVGNEPWQSKYAFGIVFFMKFGLERYYLTSSSRRLRDKIFDLSYRTEDQPRHEY
ncbi:hypothetical protein DFH08DRAFT_826070 [Mycena albidolilacea]|uniref:Uncharacterized protein n=1 Tax=Mycena albidolilacea TaxID=1033008 RepID=A0AAD6Z151_9AGAR|nr:hypothetical protein DFH08DRAFT_826070 [Mycena albidolilacea]